MTHPNEKIIQTFYEAFAAHDAKTMVAQYDASIHFSDPVFTDLKGEEAGAMWRMLVARGADLKVEVSGISADDRTGKAHWDATYTFSKTGRKVLNRIDASFVFRDGKIVEHRDQFDLYAWTKQALGPVGMLLGWSFLLQGALRRSARKELLRYMAKHPA